MKKNKKQEKDFKKKKKDDKALSLSPSTHETPRTFDFPLEETEKVSFEPKTNNKLLLAIWSILYALRPLDIYPSGYPSKYSYVCHTILRLFTLYLVLSALLEMFLLNTQVISPSYWIVLFPILLLLLYSCWFNVKLHRYSPMLRREIPKNHRIPLLMIASPIILFQLFIWSVIAIFLIVSMFTLINSLISGQGFVNFDDIH